MHRDQRFKIISDGIQYGVSATCKKHNISRTIYYRWLKRYQSEGIDGLRDQIKDFEPVNKTSKEIEASVLELISIYPSYGPKAIKYLLEELEIKISESAVYNIMKRNHLSRKENRLKYKNRLNQKSNQLPDFTNISSGSTWFFWVTECGNFKNIGNIYAYSFIDLKSRIACTRLYRDLTFTNFEDLLTSVALSIATSLNMQINDMIFLNNRRILKQTDYSTRVKVNNLLNAHGYDVNILFSDDLKFIKAVRSNYNQQILSCILDFLKTNEDFKELKTVVQGFVRQYNTLFHQSYGKEELTPVGYHNQATNTKPILPIWTYMERTY